MLKPIRPAAPIRVKYEQRVLAALAEMNRTLIREIERTWNANRPETVIAADELPAKELQTVMARIGKRWLKRFDDLAESLADYFATQTRARCDRALADMLRKGGFSVKFKMTGPMRDAFAAVRAENVGLIKSIASQHLAKVEMLVMQSVSQGHDLGQLTKALEKNYGLTRKRASLIARDQNNKATAVMRRVRETELGITEGKWLHSAGGKHPREKHVSFSGKRFKLAEGHDFGDGLGPVLPGVAINCLPGDTLIDLMNGCHEVWRYHYRGDLIAIEAGEATVSATPNHPFLTDKGWVAAEAINRGDYVWQARPKKFEAGMRNVDQAQVTIEQVFFALRDAVGICRHSPVGFNFHGDIPDTEVESVRSDPRLIIEWYTRIAEGVTDLPLALSDIVARNIATALGKVGHADLAGRAGKRMPLHSAKAGEPQGICLADAPLCQPSAGKSLADQRARDIEVAGDGQRAPSLMVEFSDSVGANLLEVANGVDPAAQHDALDHSVGDAELTRDLRHSQSSAIHLDNLVERQVNASGAGLPFTVGNCDAPSAEVLAQLVRIHAEMGSEFFEAGELRFDRVRVSEKVVRINASTHVYTLESDTGWFSAGHNSLATKNCRCTWVAIIPGFSE